MNSLKIRKRFGTYADTFFLLGLAQIAEDALRQTKQNTNIQLIDAGSYYQIQLKKSVNLDLIAKLNYFNPFPPVCGKKTTISKIPTEILHFDTVKEGETRKLYKEYLFQNHGKPQWSEDSPKPPDARTQNGVILTSLRHDKNHNDLWLDGWNLKEHYGSLLVALFQTFTQEKNSFNDEIKQTSELFKKATGLKLPDQASAVKIYFPTSVQGVNRLKADTNTTNPQKTDWLSLYLIANGLFNFAISEQVKISDKSYDWRVVSLQPVDISFSKYREILNHLRSYNPPSGGYGITRFDIELVLKSCQELLNNHQAQLEQEDSEEDWVIWDNVNHFVRGFNGTHFNSKGQVYGVKDIFNFGFPEWIVPETYQEILNYQNVLNEHLSVIIYLSSEDQNSELLRAYRNFITGNIQNFFPFQIIYADYVVTKMADSQARSPYLFSQEGLNLMLKKDTDFTTITKDSSFLRIAKAINQATVYAGKIKTKDGVKELDWQRNYGLAQLLSSQSGSKKDFICAITDFLGKYEQENLRLNERYLNEGKRLMRVQPTKKDLDRLIELIYEFDQVIIANLLIAYGYAKWTKSSDYNSEFQSLDTSEEE
jgi:hypothetical protein